MHPKPFMLHGVVREKGRGVPVCLYEKKETTKLTVAKEKWTLKVSTHKEDAEIPSIVALSLYNSKLFYFMSNACEEVKWKQTTRQVWHRDLQKILEMPFFRLNLILDYNNGMNDVDLADQVRNMYQWYLFMRKRKLWWAIIMQCLQMLQDNAYVLYIEYMTMHQLKAITHFELNRKICLAWIYSENYWPQKKRAYQHQARSGDSTSSTTQSTNTVSAEFIKRAHRFTDKSL